MLTSKTIPIIRKDAWGYIGYADAICVTTNGFVKRNGRAVMGRGIAQEARDRWPNTDLRLGCAIKLEGNIPTIIHDNITPDSMSAMRKTALVSLPVKVGSLTLQTPEDLATVIDRYKQDFEIGFTVPGWALRANLSLIEASLKHLVTITNQKNWNCVIVPVPGIGNGNLTPADVLPLLEALLDTRFIVVYR